MNLRTKATWELRQIVKALTLPISSFLNTDEDVERLEQAQIVLYERRRKNTQSIKMEVKWSLNRMIKLKLMEIIKQSF